MSSMLSITPTCMQCLKVIYGATDANVVKFCSNVCTKQFDRAYKHRDDIARQADKADLNASQTPNNSPAVIKTGEVYKRNDEQKEKSTIAKKLF